VLGHVRFEERLLFPLIERLAAADLETLPGQSEATDRPERNGGPVWGDASEDLSATVLVWAPGEGPPAHVNEERDVLIAVLDGPATLLVDDDDRHLGRGDVTIVRKGRRRAITAGGGGGARAGTVAESRRTGTAGFKPVRTHASVGSTPAPLRKHLGADGAGSAGR
jgi:quercetin dioxygenase-like cupin family protein